MTAEQAQAAADAVTDRSIGDRRYWYRHRVIRRRDSALMYECVSWGPNELMAIHYDTSGTFWINIGPEAQPILEPADLWSEPWPPYRTPFQRIARRLRRAAQALFA